MSTEVIVNIEQTAIEVVVDMREKGNKGERGLKGDKGDMLTPIFSVQDGELIVNF